MWFLCFFLCLTRGQVNDCEPSGTPAYGWKRPSRAKTAADHPVSTLPPPKGWGKIKEVFKAFAHKGVVPKWTAYRKVIKTYKPWMDLGMLRTIRSIPVQASWCKHVIGKDWRRAPLARWLLRAFVPAWLPVSVVFLTFSLCSSTLRRWFASFQRHTFWRFQVSRLLFWATAFEVHAVGV